MSEAHIWLKQATSAAHRKVDDVFSRFALDEDESYRAFLIAQATALLPIEAWLCERAGAVLADWPERARAAALANDLARLEAKAPAGAAFAASDDPAAVAGVVYVLEGSRIGGAILAKRVPGRLPKAYLSSGCDAQSWRAVVSRLDDLICDARTRTASLEAALAVFERFEQAARATDLPESRISRAG